MSFAVQHAAGQRRSHQGISIVHSVPYRLRLRVAALYRSEALKLAIEQSVGTSTGVRRIAVNVTTTSVLIFHEEDVAPSELLQRVQVIVEQRDRWPVPSAPARSPLKGLGSLFARWGRQVDGTDRTRAEPSPAWHALSPQQVESLLESSRSLGLSGRVAAERLRAFGLNTGPPPSPPSIRQIIVDQMSSLPVLLLCGSAVLSAVTGGVADAFIILFVVAGNAAIGTRMEVQAERTLSGMVELAEPPALVIRDGAAREIPSEEIVPGDLIVIARETRVAADSRLITAMELTVDESMLTGESAPVEKDALDNLPNDTPLADRRNMLYRGTIVTGGSGLAIATATGATSEVGRLQALAFGTERPDTPLEVQLRTLSGQLVAVAVGASAAVFVVGLIRGFAIADMFKTAVSLALAAIPEGLPAVATTALAGGVSALNARGIVVRRLRAMEALGTVQIACLDKTGTLTVNQMSVVEAVADLKAHRLIDGTFIAAEHREGRDPELQDLFRFAALCTVGPEHGNDISPTESSLLAAAAAAGVDVSRIAREHPLLHVRQRAEGRNVMMTLHGSGSGPMLIAIKGNPLEVLELCDWHWSGGRKHPIAALRERIVRENERLAGQGQRVLGVAFAETDDEALDESTRATWLGLIGMIDPLREAAPALVRELRNAGIVPAMLTGDQAATAAAIARQLGLNGRSSLKVVDSAQERIDEAGEGENGSVDAHVYARVSPADKLQIVRSYQQKGLVVAMTGDGVNDSPALRAADIGIAMGQSGTRVARDIADVLLLDDDILGIVLAVEEGRRVHANIRKAVHYIIASNLSELLVMFGAVALGIGRPLNPRQLLWINLLTDVLPELALALEPGERGVRGRPLDPRVPVVTRSEYRRLVRESVCIAGPTLAAYAATAARRGPSHASGIAFTALTAAQLLHAVGERSGARDASGNRSQVVPAVAAGFGVMAGGVMVPMLRRLLGLGRLGFTDMLVGLAGAGASALANCLTHQQRPASGACIPDLRTTVETS